MPKTQNKFTIFGQTEGVQCNHPWDLHPGSTRVQCVLLSRHNLVNAEYQPTPTIFRLPPNGAGPLCHIRLHPISIRPVISHASIAGWQWWNIDDPWFLKAGTLVGVTDGSYDRNRNPRICTAGWIIMDITTSSGLAGSFSEYSTSASSYRGELLGLCAINVILLALTKTGDITNRPPISLVRQQRSNQPCIW